MAVNGVGDVIALVQITAQAAKTLHEAKHAPDEIQRFIHETDRYQSCVESAAGRLRRHGALLKSHDDVKRNIQGVLEQCADTTLKLRKIATKYQQVVRKRGAATGKEAAWQLWVEAFKTVFHSIEWTTKAEMIDKLRAELSRNVQMLTWLEGGLVSDRMDQLLLEMGKIQDILTSAISSPLRTPLTSPFGLSPISPSATLCPSSQATPSGPEPNAQTQAMAPLTLTDPMLDLNDDWHFDHNIDSQLTFPKKFSFAGTTPGDEYRHVKLASNQEQQQFVQQIIANKAFSEIPVMSVCFIWQKPGSSDGVRIEASDAGKVLLVKNGNAVEDIWTLNDKKTIRFRQRVPTWDDIIPYSINGDEFTAVVEQGEGLTFFTIEHGQRQDHPKIATTWVNYTFGSKADCEHFQEILYGWDLRLLVPVSEICRPHKGRDDDRLVGCENVRVWERGPEMRLMAHLIRERGKRRKKYLEFDLCQEGIKIEGKGTRKKPVLQLSGISATIGEFELGRKGSTTSLHSFSSSSSFMRRLSGNLSPPWLDKLDIYFRSTEHRDSLLHLALSCSAKQRAAAEKREGG
ncbi:hypothetical protein A1O7_07758 [Cladophialophora yegresii CBS 114405]|uniref:Uncharacterized protein n=1 Tax=Cladophialophora yegresii CBS 114405 TaxID=1182544 RepID=W9VXI5_9EURO|nr:uncharacterized protein A1O7_07758 [Cladophialophora yegresii CBS 114405]EXJ57410.1 hypothetical protein A1O7_07758 [Cladophialophora yegresii CBS 114405]